MKTPQTRPGTRRGFTLIELLIVIAIIGIILSLVAAAVIQALKSGRRTQNRAEISQVDVGIETFKHKFGMYPPSRIRLCEKLFYYDLAINPTTGQPNNQLDTDSVQFITQMFPHIDMNAWNAPSLGVGIDWNGNGVIDPPGAAPWVPGMDCPGGITLEGDQCLVFFLGGIPVLPGGGASAQCLGFSTNPRNPASPTTDRIPPFEFDSKRLVLLRFAGNPYNRYFSYGDNYCTTDGAGTLLSGAPYAYFSSYKNPNGYNRYASFQLLQPVYPAPGIALAFGASDCSTLGLAGGAYFESASTIGTKYLKPNSFQIISAGADGFFGLGGGPWNAAMAPQMYPAGNPGFDDQSNFSSAMLNVGSN